LDHNHKLADSSFLVRCNN